VTIGPVDWSRLVPRPVPVAVDRRRAGQESLSADRAAGRSASDRP
jgi:hypothetical protein